MSVFVERKLDFLDVHSMLSFEERTLLIQLNGRSSDALLNEIEQILESYSSSDSEAEMEVELIHSLKNKIISNPNIDIEYERSHQSPLY
jgi:hypothetical protein